jgi:hypothetical protein
MAGESDESIDPKSFIKRLSPGQLGLFEPISALMLLNVSDVGFREMASRWSENACTDGDIHIIRTINHETYHFAQSAASGYMFARHRRLFDRFNNPTLPQLPDQAEHEELAAKLREIAGDDPDLNARTDQMLAVLSGHAAYALLDARAVAGDNSLAGALMPEFFALQAAIADEEGRRDAHGLSTLGVIEGSAVIHSNLLMHGDQAQGSLEAELADLPPVYSELYTTTSTAAGERALEVALPATALALCYEQPNVAYHALVRAVSDSASGGALERGRAIAADLPAIDGAGAILGSSLNVRAEHADYILYDAVIQQLATGTWGIDAYDFLANPQAMHKVASFPFGMITQDGYRGPLDRMELVARMAVMSVVLRVRGRRRREKDFRDFQIEWARSVIGRLLG